MILFALMGAILIAGCGRRGGDPTGDSASITKPAEKHFPPVPAIRNVVFISIDTCRADRLSCYGYPRPSTPNNDAVAR